MNVTLKEGAVKPQEEAKTNTKPTFFELKHYPVEGVLQQLAYMLIRPPRFIYNPELLRPARRLSGKFTLQTFRIPFELHLYRQQQMRYVILYLHGNGSSSFEGTLFLPSLPQSVGLACFDFRGCGNRQGEFITLGQDQSADVDVAARFLIAQGHRVVGWGRSMGAVSLLLSSQLTLKVADSAYADLALLCKQSSSQFLPKFCCCLHLCLFPCAFACIQSKVQSLAGLEIKRMTVADRLKEGQQGKQVCFIHGEQDTLVPSHHAQRLYDGFSGPKMLVLFEGTHNSSRPEQVLAKCFEFIEEGLRQGKSSNKLVQMDNLQRGRNISCVATSNIPNLSHLQSSEEQAIRSTSEHASISLSRAKLPREQYCEIGIKSVIPANFSDAFGGEQAEEQAYGSTISQAGRRARVSALIFGRQ